MVLTIIWPSLSAGNHQETKQLINDGTANELVLSLEL